jgi:hypothetical protein
MYELYLQPSNQDFIDRYYAFEVLAIVIVEYNILHLQFITMSRNRKKKGQTQDYEGSDFKGSKYLSEVLQVYLDRGNVAS